MMARETYVLRDGKLIPKAEAPPRPGMNYVPDIAPFETQDGTHISGRRALREYERRTGTRQVGNDMRPPGRD
jgi:hypothetical protein